MTGFLRRLGSNKWFFRLFNTGFLAINVFDMIKHWGDGGWDFWLAATLSVLFTFLALLSWVAPETYTEDRN